jgi:RNA polymerase sigma factor (sigma-70 family)
LGPDVTPTKETDPTGPPNDLALVRRVLAGDPDALEVFIDRMSCVPAILAQRNSLNLKPLTHDVMADLAQDVLIAVWRRLETFAGEGALESWVYPFCTQMYVNAVRSRQRRPPHRDIEHAHDVAAPDPAVGDVLALSDLVYRHLARLEEIPARVIRARHFDFLPFEEIARQIGIPLSTTKTHYRRGLDLLRTYLAPHLSKDLA